MLVVWRGREVCCGAARHTSPAWCRHAASFGVQVIHNGTVVAGLHTQGGCSSASGWVGVVCGMYILVLYLQAAVAHVKNVDIYMCVHRIERA